METLKEEYTVRAKMASDILENDGKTSHTTEEYKNLAARIGVDEIHIFDEAGVIVDSTNPEYFGFSFDSGEQMEFFKHMLADKSLSMCQDIMSNTAEAKPMMYAITWNQTGTRMIQIGIAPSRLLEEMDSSDISKLVERMPVTKGMMIFIVDADTQKIVGCTDRNLVGYQAPLSMAVPCI